MDKRRREQQPTSVPTSSSWPSSSLNQTNTWVSLPGLAPPSDFYHSHSLNSTSAKNPASSGHGMHPPKHDDAAATSYPASTSDQFSTEKEEGELSEVPSSRVSSAADRSSPTKPPNTLSSSTATNGSFLQSHAEKQSFSNLDDPSLQHSSKDSRFERYQYQPHQDNSPQPASHPRHERTPATAAAATSSSSRQVELHRNPYPTSTARDQSDLELSAQRERAKTFIESWNRSGFTFRQLTEEGFDAGILATLYNELGIPVEPPVQSALAKPDDPPLPKSASTFSPKQPQPPSVISKADQPPPQELNDTPQSVPTSQQSDQSTRQSYIARLMAAKSKKTISDKADTSPRPAPSSTQSQASDHVDSNLPTPPALTAALFSLNQLLKKLGLGTSFFFEQIREQSFAVKLRIPNFPSHLQPHLKRVLTEDTDQSAKCLGADVSFEADSTLLIQKQEFHSKKVAKQEAARVAYTVVTAAFEGHGQQSASSTQEAHESDKDQRPVPAASTNHEKGDGSQQNDAHETHLQGPTTLIPQSAVPFATAANSDAKRRAQTELLRQKMNALKSARLQASRTANLSSSYQTPSKGATPTESVSFMPTPRESTSDEPAADEPAPDERATDERAPDESAPDESAPDESAPDESAPDESAPDESAPDESAPDESAPVESAPDESAPDTATDKPSTPATGDYAPDIEMEQPASEENETTLISPTGKIPGLFMTAFSEPQLASEPAVESKNHHSNGQDISSIPSALGVTATSSSRQFRKRPVAADFNDDVEVPVMKRPFGQIRGGEDEDEAMIIEASDDENELDNESASQDRYLRQSAASSRLTDSPTTRKLANSGPLRSVGGENHYQFSERTQTPVSRANGFDKHQQQILEMKRKIAEMEAKRKTKLGASRPTTPLRTSSTMVRSESLEADLPSRDRTSQQPQPPADGSPHLSTAVASPPKASDAYPPSQYGTTASPSVSQSDWKQRRKTEIKSDLPAIEASFEEDSRKLEQLKLQMERLQEDMKKKQDNKKRLIEELESLGIDTDGMEHSELQATKDFLDMQEANTSNARDAETDKESPDETTTESSRSSMSISSPEETTSAPLILNTSEHLENGGKCPVVEDAFANGNTSERQGLPQTDGPNLETDQERHTDSHDDSISLSTNVLSEQDNLADTSASGSVDSSAHSADEELVEPARSSEAEMHNLSPMPFENEVIQVSSDANRGTRGLEVRMASEESEEYEPFEPPEPKAASGVDETAPHVDIGKSADSDQMDESDDEYEPAEYNTPKPLPEASHNTSSVTQSTGHLAAHAHMAPVISSNEDIFGFQRDLTHDQDLSKLDATEALPMEDRFTPYKSALKYFQSSRTPVTASAEGRSPRMLHSIDHEREICPYELAGGVCNDEKCDHQHFRSMNLEGEYQT